MCRASGADVHVVGGRGRVPEPVTRIYLPQLLKERARDSGPSNFPVNFLPGNAVLRYWQLVACYDGLQSTVKSRDELPEKSGCVPLHLAPGQIRKRGGWPCQYFSLYYAADNAQVIFSAPQSE